MYEKLLRNGLSVFVSLALAAAATPARGAVIGGSIITGAGDSAPNVKRFNPVTTSETASFSAYSGFNGGVRVAAGDVNNDGVADFVTGPNLGLGPQVKVFDGTNVANTLMNFNAYDVSFTGGVYVAAADFNHDGKADLLTGPGSGGMPNVKVFNANGPGTLKNFNAYDVSFTGGVTVAAGDVNHDGTPDIITAPSSGAQPVKVFDGVTGLQIASFNAYDPGFTGGVFVAAGDVNNDGFADIITGAGAGGQPQVKVFSGANTATTLGNFFAYTVGFTGGVRVAAADLTGDGRADIITGPGANGGSNVRVFDPTLGFTQVQMVDAYAAGFNGGVYVAGVPVPEPAGALAAASMILAALAVRCRRRHVQHPVLC